MTASAQEEFSSTLTSLMHGAIDMHVHFGPDVRPESLLHARRLDALETARDVQEAGMAAIVLKSHYWPTGGLARVLQPLVPGISLFGMTVLNYQGGDRINPFDAEVGAQLGGKIVMAPTTHATTAVAAERRQGQRTVYGVRPDQNGLSTIDDRGELVAEMHEVLDIAQQHRQAVATGHLKAPEDRALVREAHRRGLRTILTHLRPDKALLDERKWMVDHGAVVEWGWSELLVLMGHPDVDFRALIEQARALGVDSCCLTTDSGQAVRPKPSELFRQFLGRLLYFGMTPDELRKMAQTVPATLLGLNQGMGE